MSPEFLAPVSMPEAVAAHCLARGEPPPRTAGEIARCIYESLALLYRHTLEQLRTLTGREINRIHIVGGGSQNQFLNQCTADATGLEILAGPVEATALGNIAVQAIASDALQDLGEAREVISRSFNILKFAPHNVHAWDARYDRFKKLMRS